MNTDINTIKNICRYCLVNFETCHSSRLMSSLIYQICKELDIDVPAVEGLMYVNINGCRRPFAHCFNIYHGAIIDSTVYSYALMNKSIEGLFPLFIAGTPPDHMDYVVHGEIKYNFQHKFKVQLLDSIISQLDQYSDIEIKRFDEFEDARKKNLFWC